ncbi:outer membrane beta-barrel protein [Limibacter armeniacum]|uniref:outer membrane beta-barrel protein n=1 Tax=Limibacter armeniacum TaxID=466084 RepID=UPI002FE56C54
MKRNLFFVLVTTFMLLHTAVSMAVPNDPPLKGTIKGVVQENGSNVPVEYATIALFSTTDKSLAGGTVTDPDGKFTIKNVKEGTYYLEITFIGYEKKTVNNIEVGSSKGVDLGVVKLGQDAEVLEGVEVTASRPAMRYEIDKKVLDVSKQLTAASGTAVDILQNVPSIQVDVDGTVKLRGSSGFTVLIDGRPTVLEPSDVLQQMPSSAIENIEIITNPSVKYDPDGTGGIINIITKKNKLEGVSGIFNLNGGMFGRYGGDFLLNFRKSKFNYFVGGDYNNRNNPSENYNERITTNTDGVTKLISEGDGEFGRTNGGLRAGIEYNLSDNDFLSLDARVGVWKMRRSSDLTYVSEGPSETLNYYSSDETKWDGNYYAANLGYTHKFAKKGHEIVSQLNISGRDMNETGGNVQTFVDTDSSYRQRSLEGGPSTRFRFKLDYTLPINKDSKFEAGWQSRYSDNDEVNEVYFNEEFQDNLSYTTNYVRNIQSLYSLYASKFGKLGVQAGLRAEYTGREISLVGTDTASKVDRWDFFPTLHFSYQMSQETQAMVSYSRRIDRPRGWYLEPFLTYTDVNNVRRGNPGILPEFIDAYELGILKNIGDHSISLEGYYRITHNKVESISTPFEEAESGQNVFLHTFENIGKDYSLGGELMIGLQATEWWRADLMGNVYNYRVEGSYSYSEDGESKETIFDRESLNWSVRLNNQLKFGKTTSVQLNASYNGPSVTAQGRNEGFFMTSAALRQDFMNKKFTATLQVEDVFATGRRKRSSEGPNFTTYSEDFRNAPNVSVTLSYRLNNFKQKRGDRGGDAGGGDDF